MWLLSVAVVHARTMPSFIVQYLKHAFSRAIEVSRYLRDAVQRKVPISGTGSHAPSQW